MMANSGWVRIKAPSAVNVQVGINSGDVHTIAPLSVAGGGNMFSAWIKNGEGLDTIFYLINHGTGAQEVEFKWLASDGTPGNTTTTTIPKGLAIQVPASAESGL